MRLTQLFTPTRKNIENENMAMDVLIGLSQNPKKLSSKYFYDDEGSRLFQKIAKQPEYYLTRTEFEILQTISKKVPSLIAEIDLDVVELGSGDGQKTKVLLDGFTESGCRVHYYPIDISTEAMRLLEENIITDGEMQVHGVVSDYLEGLGYLRERSRRRQLILFLGSNIGNMTPAQREAFLRTIWNRLNHGDYLMIGFDLKKDIEELNRAYNDAAGVTRDFNLNLLARINRELGANFDLHRFRHYGAYNPLLGAMQSYLISRCDQQVYIKNLQKTFVFSAYEPILVEYSFKFSEGDVFDLAHNTGFELYRNFPDGHNRYLVSLWRVRKAGPQAVS